MAVCDEEVRNSRETNRAEETASHKNAERDRRAVAEEVVEVTTQQGFWLFLLAILLLYCHDTLSQESAVEIFQRTQGDEYFDSEDDARNWMMFYIATMFDAQTTRIEALQEDVREIRSQNAWILRLLAGGGGAGALGGVAAVGKRWWRKVRGK